MGPFLGLMTMYYLWRPPIITSGQGLKLVKNVAALKSIRQDLRCADVNLAALLASMYWVTQASAFFYPGAAGVDDPDKEFAFAQAYLEMVMFTLIGAGWWLERRTIDRTSDKKQL